MHWSLLPSAHIYSAGLIVAAQHFKYVYSTMPTNYLTFEIDEGYIYLYMQLSKANKLEAGD